MHLRERQIRQSWQRHRRSTKCEPKGSRNPPATMGVELQRGRCTRRLFLVAFLAAASIAVSAQTVLNPASQPLPVQRLGPNDLIAVTVIGIPDLTRSVRVDEDGFVRLPLLDSRLPPLIQTDRRVFQNRSGLQRELTLGMMTGALPAPRFGVISDLQTSTRRASNSVRPTLRNHVSNAVVGIDLSWQQLQQAVSASAIPNRRSSASTVPTKTETTVSVFPFILVFGFAACVVRTLDCFLSRTQQSIKGASCTSGSYRKYANTV